MPANRDPVFAEWPAAEYMSRAFDIIAGGERLKVTPWVFGGNMVVHRDLFTRIAFDPHVTRGEDIDYLVNAKFFGHDWLLDNTLWIRHLPPPKTAPVWRRFREDLDRFIYSRAKLRHQREGEGRRLVSVEELDPYPGRFLRDDLEEMIFRTCVLMGMDHLARGDDRGYFECMANVLRRAPGRPGSRRSLPVVPGLEEPLGRVHGVLERRCSIAGLRHGAVRIERGGGVMAESHSVLDPEVIQRCEEIGCADIVVGIPSFRNADTIAHVVKAAAAGMVKYFPGLRPVIVNSDGGSTDDTIEVVMQTPVPPEVRRSSPPTRGCRGRARPSTPSSRSPAASGRASAWW